MAPRRKRSMSAISVRFPLVKAKLPTSVQLSARTKDTVKSIADSYPGLRHADERGVAPREDDFIGLVS